MFVCLGFGVEYFEGEIGGRGKVVKEKTRGQGGESIFLSLVPSDYCLRLLGEELRDNALPLHSHYSPLAPP